MQQLTLRLFGSFSASAGGLDLRLPTDKTCALLVTLALKPDAPLRRETLAGLFWPDQPEDLARQNLRKTAGRLKQAVADQNPKLADQLLTLTRQTIELHAAACAADALTYRGHLEKVRLHGHPGAERCETCLALLEEAVGLYRQGEFLAGLSLPDAAPFEEWLLVERENLHRLQLSALQQLTSAYEQQGTFEKARQYAQWQIQEEPWREDAHRQLMRLLAAHGQRAEAIAQFQACRRILQDELGVEPDPETEALYTQIMEGELPLAPALPAAALARSWPRLHGPLIGRDTDLSRLAGLLAEPACRVITITGLGGVGKTSLAIAVGEQLIQSAPPWLADGIHFVPLAAITNASLLPAAIAEAAGLTLNQRQSIAAQVEQTLRHKAMLLILDNFEQLTRQADWLHSLAASTTHLKLLITSREPLNWQGEWRYPLEGLAYPQDETEGGDFDAVRLFVQAARQVQPSFAYNAENGKDISRICRLVYGWPLALQLAAAWVRMMSCQAIADQIRSSGDFLATSLQDVPARQRSMRVIFEHTWSSLSSGERGILTRLAVFRGGFTLAAAVEVAATTPLVLSGLVDKSLVRHDERNGRYSMHELLRQFVSEQPAAEQDSHAAAQASHGRYYLALLSTEEARLNSIQFKPALEVIQADLDNVRQAWLWATSTHAYELLTASLSHMAMFYESSGLPQEGAALFQSTLGMLQKAGAGPPASLVARVLYHQAESLLNMGQYSQATAAINAAQQIAPTLDDMVFTNQLLILRALIHREQGQYEQALGVLKEAVAYSQAHDNQEGEARALHVQGNTYWSMALYQQARESYEAGREIYRRLGQATPMSILTGNIGVVHWRLGQYDQALEAYQVALEAHRALGEVSKVAVWLGNIGLLYMDLRDDEKAMSHLDAALEMHDQLGRKFYKVELLLGKVALHVRGGQLDRALEAHQQAAQLALLIGNPTHVLDCDLWQARLYAAQERTDEARQLLESLRTREFRPDASAAIAQALDHLVGN